MPTLSPIDKIVRELRRYVAAAGASPVFTVSSTDAYADYPNLTTAFLAKTAAGTRFFAYGTITEPAASYAVMNAGQYLHFAFGTVIELGITSSASNGIQFASGCTVTSDGPVTIPQSNVTRDQQLYLSSVTNLDMSNCTWHFRADNAVANDTIQALMVMASGCSFVNLGNIVATGNWATVATSVRVLYIPSGTNTNITASIVMNQTYSGGLGSKSIYALSMSATSRSKFSIYCKKPTGWATVYGRGGSDAGGNVYLGAYSPSVTNTAVGTGGTSLMRALNA